MDAAEMHKMIRSIRSDLYSAANVFNRLSCDCFDVEDVKPGCVTMRSNTRFPTMAAFARTLLRDLDKVRRDFNKASLQLAKESVEQRRKERIQRQGGN